MKAVAIDEDLEEQIGVNLRNGKNGSSPYMIQINEVTVDERKNLKDRREQLIHFPKIKANPRDQMLQNHLKDRSSRNVSFMAAGPASFNHNRSRDTISLNSQDIKNYQLNSFSKLNKSHNNQNLELTNQSGQIPNSTIQTDNISAFS